MSASYLDEARLRRSIVATATAPGRGAIGIVRSSGSDALEVGARIFSRPHRILSAESHTMHYGRVISPDGSIVDDVLAAVMRAPRSYTGENSLEFHTHGGRVQVDRVLAACVEAGSLPALPGEFTFRAFLNGKIDLVQAEAVADMISASTETAARNARLQSEGVLRSMLTAVRDQISEILARCEASIDFVDDDIPDAERPIMIESMEEIGVALERLIASFSVGRILREGARVVLAGGPNVGKSSVFNAILRTDRAIVTDIPGTTRDELTEAIAMEGVPVILTDTAGMRESTDRIEQEGVRRSRRAQEVADLILQVIDCAQDPTEGPPSQDPTEGQTRLVALNKSDLVTGSQAEGVQARYPEGLFVSARTGDGIAELCDAIHDKLVQGSILESEPVITRQRHLESLRGCREALGRAHQVLTGQSPLELAALEMRMAGEALDELVGKVYTEDILERIFREFCIGK